MLQLSLSLGLDLTTDRRQVCKHAVCGADAPALLTSTSTRPVILSASAATCAFYLSAYQPSDAAPSCAKRKQVAALSISLSQRQTRHSVNMLPWSS